MSVQIIRGDCLIELQALADCSVDSCVTDPPYHLTTGKKGGTGPASVSLATPQGRARVTTGFMGMKWDGGDIAHSVELWIEVLRVLKPGAYLLAFGGTRTYHRLACAIEDAGFEIRDQIGWVYSSGFPKSMNLDRLRGVQFCGCKENENAKPGLVTRGNEAAEADAARKGTPEAERHLRSVFDAHVSTAEQVEGERRQVLQHGLQEQGLSAQGRLELPAAEVRLGQPSVEGWRDSAPPARELCAGAIRESARMGAADGEEGRLCDGASACDGEPDRPDPAARGGSSPRRSCATEQRADEPGVVAGQSESQTLGAWPNCGRCGLPIIPSGLGTALKPAWEPIVMARKPIIGTVAANVQQFGMGALNIDDCRVGVEERTYRAAERSRTSSTRMVMEIPESDTWTVVESILEFTATGRWPANLIHDGSEEVLAAFPQAPGQIADASSSSSRKTQNVYGDMKRGNGRDNEVSSDSENEGEVGFKMKPGARRLDSGSAARFFYCAKASKDDREEGLEWLDPKRSADRVKADGVGGDNPRNRSNRSNRNHHPTVKPTDLMRYLCRLVTPKGGTVLDPFMGSGSTGRGAIREGFGFIGIEIDPEYCEIARLRIHADAPMFAEVAA